MANGENRPRNLIFVVCFIAFYSAIVLMVGPIFVSAELSYDSEQRQMIENKFGIDIAMNYNFKYPVNGYSSDEIVKGNRFDIVAFNFVSTNAGEYKFSDTADTDDGRQIIRLYVLEGAEIGGPGYSNIFTGFMFYKTWGFITWEQSSATVTYEQIKNSYIEEQGYSYLSFKIADNTEYLFVEFDPSTPKSEIINKLYNGEFRVSLGTTIYDAQRANTNGFVIVGQLLTFSMPNVHPVIQVFFAVPMYVSVVYLIYVLILMAIPFVGGS